MLKKQKLTKLLIIGALIIIIGAVFTLFKKSDLAQGESRQGWVARREMDNGQPIAQRCGPFHWTMNPGSSSKSQQRAIKEAVNRLSKATGRLFEYDGPTKQSMSKNNFDRGRNGRILIEWYWPSNSPRPKSAGWAEPFRVGNSYKGGYIFLNRDVLRGTSTEYLRLLTMHELGHIMGLDHSKRRDSIMHTPITADSYTTIDRLGFKKLNSVCTGSQRQK